MDLPDTHHHSPILAAARAVKQARRGVIPSFDHGPLGDLEHDLLVEGLPLWFASRRGALYLASNSSWPGLYKIGCTRKSVERRLAELGGAGLATPWCEVRRWCSYDAHGIEALAHVSCEQWRYQGELFLAPAETLIESINQAIQADRALLEGALQAVFLPGQFDELLNAAAYQEAATGDLA